MPEVHVHVRMPGGREGFPILFTSYMYRGQGGSCHEVIIVNFRFHESQNKKYTSVKFTKVRKNLITMQWNSAMNSTLDIHILFIHDSQPRTYAFHASRNTLQSRFTEQIFTKSRLTQHKKTGSRRNENTLAPPLYMCRRQTYESSNSLMIL